MGSRRKLGFHSHDGKLVPVVDVKQGRCADDGAWHHSGLELFVTRRGIELSGYYDSMVGIEGVSVSWEELEAMRREVEARRPRGRRAPSTGG